MHLNIAVLIGLVAGGQEGTAVAPESKTCPEVRSKLNGIPVLKSHTMLCCCQLGSKSSATSFPSSLTSLKLPKKISGHEECRGNIVDDGDIAHGDASLVDRLLVHVNVHPNHWISEISQYRGDWKVTVCFNEITIQDHIMKCLNRQNCWNDPIFTYSIIFLT